MKKRERIANRAKTPPMGWNSWDCFGPNATEEEVKANADFMAKHLKQYGWEYVVLDLGWYGENIDDRNYKQPNIPLHVDAYGRLIPDPVMHPSSKNGTGLQPLADYVHTLGLKFGLHIMRGIPWKAVEEKCRIKGTDKTADQISYKREICPWFNSMHTLDFSQPEAQKYYDSIMELYASWGVDYIKADDVNAWHEVERSTGSPTGEGSPYRIDDIEGMSTAIDNCGRDIVFSLSPGGPETTVINHLRKNVNSWRISADFWDEWGSFVKQTDRCAIWAPFVTQGHWPDADMLPFGYMPRGESGGHKRFSNFSIEEQKSVISLWCMFRSPLMFGGHLPRCGQETIDLLTNQEILDINQHSFGNKEFYRTEDVRLWTAQNRKGSVYVALFNLAQKEQEIQFGFNSLGLKGSRRIYDLWLREELGEFANEFKAKVNAHSTMVLRIS